jgi:peptidyl-prolyl cis-trans isomerase A (cyclophilin A)
MSKILSLFTLIVLVLTLSACTSRTVSTETPSLADTIDTQSVNTLPTSNMNSTISGQLHATIKTSLGDIKVLLYSTQAPNTVANFVGLAQGTKTWKDPQTGADIQGKSLYEGTIFHRVIPNFMIQAGDPLGNGTGSPGYRFADEFVPTLNFDKPYLLAMANSGPNTNGSQFFITTVETPWLNQKHTIFGEVVSGQEIVDQISATTTGQGDKPVTDIIIKSIAITDESD